MMPSAPDLQLLRPAWLLALLLLPVLAWAWRLRARRRSAWRTAVDPHLLPHLLDARAARGGGTMPRMAVLAGLAVAIVALAGPSWRGVPQPLQAGGGALVIALDLSSASLANDLPPTRLAQARARIDALLRAHGGDVALVAYADDAFVVAPVTPDPANVAVFLDALAPDVMPVDGQRPERAIALASALLEQAGHARGDILLLAPTAGPSAVRAAAAAAGKGHRVSTLGMGTAAGAGYRGGDGEIRRSALEAGALQALAVAGGGHAFAWDTPPQAVAAALDADGGAGAGAATLRDGLVREDGGFWLLPLALLLLLPAFRRGLLVPVLALCLVLPWPPASAADGDAPAAGLWRRADQAAHARSAEAEAAFRKGDFDAAARGFATLPGADAAYNRGNALARAGRYDDAIAAYDQALREAPGMADAEANRAAVEAAKRRQPPSGGGDGGGNAPRDGGQRGRDPGDEGARGDAGQGAPDRDPGRSPARDSGTPAQPAPAEGAPTPEPPPGPPADDARARQQAADQAQREAMQRALEAGDGPPPGTAPGEPPAPSSAASPAEDEREQANAAWLRRVPDDPGALLRARFRNEHLRRRAGER